MIVLDTSALLFWTLFPERLSLRAKEVVESDQPKIISSISIWEIGLKTTKGHLVLPDSLKSYTNDLKRSHRLTIHPVTEEIWIENLVLDWSHRDPADRTIVATAKLLDVPLLTSDRAILAFYEQAVW